MATMFGEAILLFDEVKISLVGENALELQDGGK